MNRLRKEAEFHWRLEPYAGKPARTVLRGEDGSNVIFLLDVYKCTESLRSRKVAQYPSHYGSSRTSRYRDDISKKKVCADCVGLIKGYCWTGGGKGVIESIGTDKTYSSTYGGNGCPDKSANGMFSYAKSKGCSWGTMDSLPEVPGIALRSDGHVGCLVYTSGRHPCGLEQRVHTGRASWHRPHSQNRLSIGTSAAPDGGGVCRAGKEVSLERLVHLERHALH